MHKKRFFNIHSKDLNYKRIVEWNNIPIVLNTKEAGNLLAIKSRALRKIVKNKNIPAGKVNNVWRFLKEKIYDWTHKYI